MHGNPNHAPDSRPGRGIHFGGGGTREEEAPAPGGGVHRAFHRSEETGDRLPLVQQDRFGKTVERCIGIHPEGARLPGVVKPNDGGGVADRGCRLPDAAGADDHQCRMERKKLRKTLVEQSGSVA